MSVTQDKIIPDRFLTMFQSRWNAVERDLAYYDLGDVVHLMCPQAAWMEAFDLGGFDINVTPSVPLPPLTPAGVKEHWPKAAKFLAKSGRAFDFWAIFRSNKREHGPGYELLGCQMTRAEFDSFCQVAGENFWGWEIGEWDGLYGRDIASYWTPDQIPETRLEAHARFMEWIKGLHAALYDNTTALCGLTFPHYFHEIPTRMLGAEVGQGLLNTQVYISFLRGAKTQYGLEFRLFSSVFDRWGYRCYTSGKAVTQAGQDGNEPVVFEAGPVDGHTIGLLKAIWFVGYFAESAAVGLDGGYFVDDVDDRGVRQLSPLGEEWMRFREWSRNPTPCGKSVRPLGIMLDYHCGWTPPRHLYSFGTTHRVWHTLPYGSADFAMDRLYNALYPGYTDSGFYRDERGFLVSTPCGDCADVLLTDSSTDAMADYPIIWLLSDTPVDAALQARLRKYIEKGGHLVVGATPAASFLPQWDVGASIGESLGRRKCAFKGNVECRENFYSVFACSISEAWSVRVATENAEPLVMSRTIGDGRLTVIATAHGLTEDLTAPGLDMYKPWQFTPADRFELLHCVERLLRDTILRAIPLVVSPGIYWSVNDIGNRKYIVCLYNQSFETWSGRISADLPLHVHREPGPWQCVIAEDGLIRLEQNQMSVYRVEMGESL